MTEDSYYPIQILHLTQYINSFSHEHEELKNSYHNAKARITILEKSLDSTDESDQIQSFQRSIQTLLNENKTLQAQNEKHNIEILRLQNQMNQSQKENRLLKTATNSTLDALKQHFEEEIERVGRKKDAEYTLIIERLNKQWTEQKEFKEREFNELRERYLESMRVTEKKERKRLGGAGYTVASLFDDDGDGSEEEVGSDGEVVQSLLPFQFLDSEQSDVFNESRPASSGIMSPFMIHNASNPSATPSMSHNEDMQVEILELRKINEELGHQVEQLKEQVYLQDKADLITKLEQQTQELARLRKSGEQLEVEREKRKLFEWELKMKTEQIEKFLKTSSRLTEGDTFQEKSDHLVNFENEQKDLEGTLQCNEAETVHNTTQSDARETTNPISS